MTRKRAKKKLDLIKIKISLIVGLANPGAQYSNTRHNVGAWFIASLLQQANLQLKINTKLHATIAQDQDYKIMIPTCYMNESGRAVRAVTDYYKIAPQDLLVVHDDLDLEPGIVRYRESGGHGGHNGLRDIINCLGGNRDFQRLKFGIGHPGDKDHVTDYVLSKPSKNDFDKITGAIDQALINRSDYGF